MRKPGWLILPMIAVSMLAACSGSGDTLQVGDAAPQFTLQSADGATVSLNQYAGTSPVLLYFHMAVG